MLDDFNICDYDEKKIVLCGAGVVGTFISRKLDEQGIDNYIFCDINPTNNTEDVRKVISYEELLSVNASYYIISSERFFHEITTRLIALGIEKNRIFSAATLMQKNNTSSTFPSKYIEAALKERASLRDMLYIHHLDLTITEHCTLRCKNCANLVTYYQNPCSFTDCEVIHNFDVLLSADICIGGVTLLGGEPLTNQRLVRKILQRYRGNSKIGHFVIYTNGTIVPNKETIDAVHEYERCYFVFSKYNGLSNKLDACINLMQEENICYTILDDDNSPWWSYGIPKHYTSRNAVDTQ